MALRISSRIRTVTVTQIGLMAAALALFIQPITALNFAPVQAAPIIDRVVINEIMADPAAGDIEWVELYNPTDVSISLDDWRLRYNSATNFSGVFDRIVIPAKGYVVREASSSSSQLRDTDATLELLTSERTVIDMVAYNGITEGKSYARSYDASSDFTAQATPTKGSSNGQPPLVQPIDSTKPTASLKSSSRGNIAQRILQKADFRLSDNSGVRAYIVNGTRYQVGVNRWSDANGISVGTRSGVLGRNVITVEDTAGNLSDEFVFTLDNGAPLADVKPESKHDNDRYRTISYKLYDEYGVDKISLNGVVKDLADNPWSDLNNITEGVFGARAGTNELVVYDVAGNTQSYTFFLDSTAPVAAVTSPSADAMLTGTVPIRITATDDNLAAYSYRIIEESTRKQIVSKTVSPATGVEDEDVFAWDTTQSANGRYSVYVSARDTAGNRSEQRIDVTVANTPPAPEEPTGPVTTISRVENRVISGTTTDEDVTVSILQFGGEGFDARQVTDFRITPTAQDGVYAWSFTVPESMPSGVVKNLEVRLRNAKSNVEYPVMIERDVTFSGSANQPPITPVQPEESEPSIPSEGSQPVGNEGSASGSPTSQPNSQSIRTNLLTALVPITSSSAIGPAQAALDAAGGNPVAQSNDDDENGDVLGSSRDNAQPADTAAALTPSAQGWMIAGVAWYWWLLALAALGGAWWTIASLKRRAPDTLS